MTTNLYFHDATTTDTGTLPSTALGIWNTTQATGALTNRAMTTTRGTLQTSITVASGASVANQGALFRRFVSAPLAAQSIGSTTVGWLLQGAGQTSNASNSAWVGTARTSGYNQLWVWRPSTGATTPPANAGYVAIGWWSGTTTAGLVHYGDGMSLVADPVPTPPVVIVPAFRY